MTFPQTIIRYGEPELVYVHIEPIGDDRWYCTMSRLHPSAMRTFGMDYARNINRPLDYKRVLKKYAKFLEDYYRA